MFQPWYTENGTVMNKRENEKDRFHNHGKEGSWTIKLDDLEAHPKVEWIRFITDEETYTISKKDAYAYALRGTFKGVRKLIVDVVNWSKGGIKPLF